VGGLSINCKCDACLTVQSSNVKFRGGDKKEAKPVARKRACTKWQKISSLEKLQHAADGGKYSTLLLRPDILDNQGKSKVSPPEARV
jgi:hypothetical protein